MDDMQQRISEQDLSKHNGEGGARRWIALEGIVYDVTDCPKWHSGLHEQMHFAGLDLTTELPDAPHGHEVLLRPCVKKIGYILSGDTT